MKPFFEYLEFAVFCGEALKNRGWKAKRGEAKR